MNLGDQFGKIVVLASCSDWVNFWLEKTIRLLRVSRLFPMARDSRVEIHYNTFMLLFANDFQVCLHESSDDSTLSGSAQPPAGW